MDITGTCRSSAVLRARYRTDLGCISASTAPCLAFPTVDYLCTRSSASAQHACYPANGFQLKLLLLLTSYTFIQATLLPPPPPLPNYPTFGRQHLYGELNASLYYGWTVWLLVGQCLTLLAVVDLLLLPMVNCYLAPY